IDYDQGQQSPCWLTVMGSRIFFSVDGGPANGGLELWSTDGTTAGTARVADVAPGTDGSSPRELVALNGTVYFVANVPQSPQLWKSDGTAAGTVLVASFPSNSTPGSLRVANQKLIFAVLNPTGTQLWASDGTSAGTARVGTVVIATQA